MDDPHKVKDDLMDREEHLPSFGRGFPRVRSAPLTDATPRSASQSAIANEMAAPLPRVGTRPDETTPPIDPDLLRRFRAVPAGTGAHGQTAASDSDALDSEHSVFAQTNITGVTDGTPTLVGEFSAAQQAARDRALGRGRNAGPAAGLSAFAQTNLSGADPVEVRRQANQRAEQRAENTRAENTRAGALGAQDPHTARLAEAMRKQAEIDPLLAETSLPTGSNGSPGSGPGGTELSISNHRIDRSTETWLEDLTDEQSVDLPQDFFDVEEPGWQGQPNAKRPPRPTPPDPHAAQTRVPEPPKHALRPATDAAITRAPSQPSPEGETTRVVPAQPGVNTRPKRTGATVLNDLFDNMRSDGDDAAASGESPATHPDSVSALPTAQRRPTRTPVPKRDARPEVFSTAPTRTAAPGTPLPVPTPPRSRDGGTDRVSVAPRAAPSVNAPPALRSEHSRANAAARVNSSGHSATVRHSTSAAAATAAMNAELQNGSAEPNDTTGTQHPPLDLRAPTLPAKEFTLATALDAIVNVPPLAWVGGITIFCVIVWLFTL